MIRNLPRKTIIQLTHIINSITILQHFPSQSKSSTISMIHKPGKIPNALKSYRPISLVNTLGKLTEKVLLPKILAEVDSKGIIPEEQFGFRKGKSTTVLATRIVNDALQAFESDEVTSLVLLDMERAFDKVWHDGLLYKLYAKFHLPLHLVSLIRSYLKGHSFAVKIGNSLSAKRFLSAGVTQGTVLSPQLYTLFIADIPKSPGTSLALYADDTAVYSSFFFAQETHRLLQHHLDILGQYYNFWKIKINPDKIEANYH